MRIFSLSQSRQGKSGPLLQMAKGISRQFGPEMENGLPMCQTRGTWWAGHRWIQALDGGKPRILEGSDGDPHLFSLDGKWLIYLSRRPDRPNGFYASRVNSRGELSGEPVLLKATISNHYGKPVKWTTDGADYHARRGLQRKDLRPKYQER